MPDPTTPATPTFGPDVSGQSPEQDQAKKRALNMGLLAAGLGLLSARTGGNVWRAIGEGGMVGLDAYSQTLQGEQKARDDRIKQQYEQERIDVAERRANIEQQRADAYQEHLLKAEQGGGKLTEAETYAKNIQDDYAAAGHPITAAQAMHLAYRDKPQITTTEMESRSHYNYGLRMRERATAENWARGRQTQKEAYEQQAARESANLKSTADLNKYLATPFLPPGGTDKRPWTKNITYNPDGTYKISVTPPPPTGMGAVFARILHSPPPPPYESPSMREPGAVGDGLPAYSGDVSPFGAGMDPVSGGFALTPEQDAVIRKRFKDKGWTDEQVDQFLSTGGARGYSPETHASGTLPHSPPEVVPPLSATTLSYYHITPGPPPAGIPGVWDGHPYAGAILGTDGKTQIPVWGSGKDIYIKAKYKSLLPPTATTPAKKADADSPPVGAVLVKGRTYKGKPVYRTKDGKLWSP